MNVADANRLFIEAGAMSGGSRNQTEFGEDLAPFFGDLLDQRFLTIAAGGKTRNDRTLTHKVTTMGVDIWRLSLPTRDQGGPVYEGRVILLRKLQSGGRQEYRVTATDSGSDLHESWRQKAAGGGHLATTSGGRECGYWSE